MRRGLLASIAVLVGLSLNASGFCQESKMTVSELYDKLLANYGNIQDMKYVLVHSSNQPTTGLNEVTYTGTHNIYYKAPRMAMAEWYQNKAMRWVLKDKALQVRKIDTGKVSKEEYSEAEFTQSPEDPSFAERMIEYFNKYEDVSIIGNSEPGVYVIKATPKDPESDKEGHEGIDVQVIVDARKGVLRKMTFWDYKYLGNDETKTIEWEKISEISPGIYFPMFIRNTVHMYKNWLPPEQRLKERKTTISQYELKDIQVNTGLQGIKFKP